MEKHGIHYFFQQTDTNHKMIIVDGPPYSAAEESPVTFHRSKDSRGTVRRWTHSYEPADPQVDQPRPRLSDQSSGHPAVGRDRDSRGAKSTQGDHFEFPGGFAVLTSPGDESDYAHNLARTRVQEEETRFDVFSGNSVRATFAAGTRIKIIGVAEQKQEERITVEEEKDYLITSVTFSATEVGYTDDKAGEIVAKLISDAAIAGALRGLDRFDDAQKNNMPDVNKVINSLPGDAERDGGIRRRFHWPVAGAPARLGIAGPVGHTGPFHPGPEGAEAAAIHQFLLLRANRQRPPISVAQCVEQAARAGSADRHGLWSHRRRRLDRRTRTDSGQV